MKASIIAQARISSTRLLGKVLRPILGKTVLEHLIIRLKAAKMIDNIIVATTDAKEDGEIVAIAEKLRVKSYQGSVNDVLDRFYKAAKQFGAQHIVRITADCPLMDPAVVDEGVAEYFSSGADYCSNVIIRTFPDGEDVEIFSFAALEKAWKEAKLSSDREHVTTYIRKHPEKFKLTNFKNNLNIADKRWTLDREEDFIFMERVYGALYAENPRFGMRDILDFLKKNPELEEINKMWAKRYE